MRLVQPPQSVTRMTLPTHAHNRGNESLTARQSLVAEPANREKRPYTQGLS